MTNTQKLCKECEFFHIKYEPIKDVDFGQAECKKHNLVTDFASHRLLNRLRCVEKGENEDGNNTGF